MLRTGWFRFSENDAYDLAVTAADPRTWPGFERLVAALHAKVDPAAAVRWNEAVLGKSGTRRQLDVTVRGRIGTTDLFVVVECKDYSRPVGIELVEAFVAKLEDVAANKGVMVARTGFTRDALARAERAGISPAVLRPARDEDWDRYLRSLLIKIQSRVIVHNDLSVVLADGRELPVSWADRVEAPDGRQCFMDMLVNGWLHDHAWEDGKPIRLGLDPAWRLLRDDELPGVAEIKCRPRWGDGFAVEANVVRPEDWVFMRCCADGRVDDEKHFFEFRELEQLAKAFAPAP